jgi:hypothetical protein
MAKKRRHPVGFAWVLLSESGIYRLRIEAAEDLPDEAARMSMTRAPPVSEERHDSSRSGVSRGAYLRICHRARSYRERCPGVDAQQGAATDVLDVIDAQQGAATDVLDVRSVAANPQKAPAQADQHERLVTLGERVAEQSARPARYFTHGA